MDINAEIHMENLQTVTEKARANETFVGTASARTGGEETGI